MSRARRRPGPAAASRELAAADAVMAALYERHGPARLGPRPRVEDRFGRLARSIVYQQLAGAAAAAIWQRTVRAVGGDPTPAAFLDADPRALRAAGLSANKSAAVLDLASQVAEGRLDLAAVGRYGDDRVIAELTRVHGVGRWTAQMFLIFSLRRLDVWPAGDLGVRKGYQRAYGLADLPSPATTESLGTAFHPYRSVAAWYCWRAAEARPEDAGG